MARVAGEALERPCGNARHGGFSMAYGLYEHDPGCQTCLARSILAEHDHLHLDGAKCETVGVGGVAGQTVKCSCGSYHH